MSIKLLLSKKKVKIRYSFFFVLVLILGFSFISNIILPFLNESSTNIEIDSLSAVENEMDVSDNSYNNPIFSLQPFQQPRILFVVGNPSALSSTYDIPFLNYMVSILNFNVTLHDDDNSYSYDDYDAIVISRTIGESGTVDSLANAPIPIITMECYNYDVFQLGSGRGSDLEYDRIYLLNTNHFITQGFSLGNLDVYTNQYRLEFLENYDKIGEEVEIVSLAQRTFFRSEERTLAVLDKGKKAWDLSIAPERRAYWGAVDGSQLSGDGWTLWNKTLHWILYDDVRGNASISVNVIDLDNRDVTNARVNLTDSLNSSQSWSQNSTGDGYTTFTNVPFGYYNITVEFEDSTNDTLSFLEIAGDRTHELEPYFEFMVQVNEYIDNSPPVISNIHFAPNNNTGGNFSANVYDISSLMIVNLSLTVRNVTDGEVLRDKSYKMITKDYNYYYNDTALEGFQNKLINVTYNITAIDIAGNPETSDNYFFTLGDIIAPTIYEFNVTDHENGTLMFYANVSDDKSLVSEVILRINDSFDNMYLNASGFWVYVTNAYYGIVLNYSISSAIDSVGNENTTPVPEFGLVTPIDTLEPLIWGVSDTFSTHENGYVEFTAYIKDWNDYQSGVNFSDVQIIIEKNGLLNDSYNMFVSGEEVFSFDQVFTYNDSIRYWIKASDMAGNVNPGYGHGPFTIDDNAIPQVTFGAKEFGNGTIEFNATVLDWPNNQTTVYLHYTQDYFGTWINISMTNISNYFYVQQVSAFDYNRYEVWCYVTAIDPTLNSFIPSPDQYLKIDLTDKVSPNVVFTITNSSENDGEISITAWAIDSYGRTPYINNTFHLNFTTSEGTLPFEMEYDTFNFYTFNYSFEYRKQVTILVYTMDEAGNLGKINKTIIVGDFAPPKIKEWGVIEFQNGTVTIWAEIEEDPNGSGLPEDNSSILIEYVFISLYTKNMGWNGSKSFFSYTISGFEPENAFTYRITAFDKSNNSYTTEWIQESIFDKTPPTYTNFGYSETLVNHSCSQLNFWIDAMDTFGSIDHVILSFSYLNDTNWLNRTFEMQYNDSFYTYSILLACNRSFRYAIHISDRAQNAIEANNTNLRSYWGPVIINTDVDHISDNELIIWANVSDWGSGIAEVLLEYEFISYEGSGAFVAGISIINSTVMVFNGSVYFASLTFYESGTFSWRIVARDSSNQSHTIFAQPYNFYLPAHTIEWADLVPLLIAVGIIPALLVTLIFVVRKRHMNRLLIQKRKQMEIIDRSTDIFSLRVLICRNHFGTTLYTENFVGSGQDGDMIAGITTAMSSLVTDIAQREINSGEFDSLEREGFSILSHHGNYLTISLISEGKLSSFMKRKMQELVNQIENLISKEEMESVFQLDLKERIKRLAYEILPIGLLRPLTVDLKLLAKKKKHFKKNERKLFEYIAEVPSFIDAQQVFHAMTLISSFTVHGIPLVKVFRFLEECYNLGVIRNISEAEMRFFGSDSFSSAPDLLNTEQ